MSPPSLNDSVSSLQHHKKYFINGGDLYVLVEKTMFRVHGFFFSRDSPLFNVKLNPASPGQAQEGTSESTALKLAGVTPEEFEKFLWIFYNPKYSLYDAKVEDWRCILNLADKWDFNEVKELAVRELHKKNSLSIVEKMALYAKYKVDSRHLVPLYAALCARDTALTLEESRILGIEATVLVSSARERLRAKPSDEGRSPLPQGLETDDVFRTIEILLEMEQGSTTKFNETNSFSNSYDTNPNILNGDTENPTVNVRQPLASKDKRSNTVNPKGNKK
ncbi:hypothetical protein B0H34DRAFT_701175 [Crassisporium funariophilum]|nr:hypothetical protein B0H34DRAFT_701175 [Crassisporium funariophilum]